MLTNTKPVLYQPEFFAVAETLISSLVLIMVQETRDMLVLMEEQKKVEKSKEEKFFSQLRQLKLKKSVIKRTDN